jgi:hypothetical protein
LLVAGEKANRNCVVLLARFLSLEKKHSRWRKEIAQGDFVSDVWRKEGTGRKEAELGILYRTFGEERTII